MSDDYKISYIDLWNFLTNCVLVGQQSTLVVAENVFAFL